MDSLVRSVEQTLRNLQEKKQFLQQQRDRYILIREKIIQSDGGQEKEDVMMYGDVIISPEKVFVNLGYEYYVEKRRDEVLQYVDGKRKLIDQAIAQFESKIEDGEKAILGFDTLLESEQSKAQSQDDDFSDQLPSMEIREELDEDGNVISSSVTPTMASLKEKKKNSGKAHTSLEDFKQNLKGKLIENSSQEERGNVSNDHNYNQMSSDNMYTFADLVRQMDEQDEMEDAVDTEVNYDFESFERIYEKKYHEDQVDDEDEGDGNDYDDDEDDNRYMVAPTMEAHSAFMDRLMQLRQQKVQIDRNEETKPAVKSILKKSKDAKSKPKKSVGFASTLDIHEVESLKQDNLRNRHELASTFMQPLEHETEEEFDADLFAQLIGARGPDEIHDKYKSEAMEQDIDENLAAAGSSKRKSRVSRFKQERKGRDSQTHKQSNGYHARPITVLPEEKRFDQAENDDGAIVTDVSSSMKSNPIVERDVDGSAMADTIVEKDTSASHVLGNVEDDDLSANDEASSTPADSSGQARTSSIFSKKLNSLQRSTKLGKSKNPKQVYEFSDSSDSESDAPPDSDELPPGSKSSSLSEAFPKEVMDKVRNIDTISIPNVDYTALGDNLDDMVKAYSLGIYDDDLDEDPGMLLEKVDDFEQYNKQVEDLKSEIEEFKIENPIQEMDNEDDSGPLMTEIKENDVPQSYNDVDADDDLALEPSRLSESIAIEYSRLRQAMNFKSNDVLGISYDSDEESKQFEPVDNDGAPIKVSRFKTQRLKIGK